MSDQPPEIHTYTFDLEQTIHTRYVVTSEVPLTDEMLAGQPVDLLRGRAFDPSILWSVLTYVEGSLREGDLPDRKERRHG